MLLPKGLPATLVFGDTITIVPNIARTNGHSGPSLPKDADSEEVGVVVPMASTVLPVVVPAGIDCGVKVTVVPGGLPIAVNVVTPTVGLAVVVSLIVKEGGWPAAGGTSLIAKSAPMPDKLIESGVSAASCEILTAADKAPVLVGLKLGTIVQFPPTVICAGNVPHVVDTSNCAASVPVNVMLLMVSTVVPALARVIASGFTWVSLTFTLPKDTSREDSNTGGSVTVTVHVWESEVKLVGSLRTRVVLSCTIAPTECEPTVNLLVSKMKLFPDATEAPSTYQETKSECCTGCSGVMLKLDFLPWGSDRLVPAGVAESIGETKL